MSTVKSIAPEQMMEESLFMSLKLHLDNAHDTEDAAADGVLAMLEAQAKADPEKGSTVHYMRKCAFGAIHNFYSRNKRRRNHESLSLTVQVNGEDGLEFIDRIPEVEGESYQDRLESTESDQHIRDLVDSLPAKERQVILGRFFRGQTLGEIGEELGVTTERVRQIEEKTLSLLRHRYEHAR